MLKSTIIATCLLRSSMFQNLSEAEGCVLGIFKDEFPARDFSDWNTDMNDRVAKEIVKNVGRASRIDVRRFILDLSE